MSDAVSLNTFPGSTVEGLAAIWAENHVQEAKTPQDLCRIYWEAYYQIALINRATAREIKAKLKD